MSMAVEGRAPAQATTEPGPAVLIEARRLTRVLPGTVPVTLVREGVVVLAK